MSTTKSIFAPSRQLFSLSNCLARRQFSPCIVPQPQPLLSRPSRILQPTNAFSTTASLLARKDKRGPKKDQRISSIRYFLQHPLNPRPLRFSRSRHLRHWTIHRAWQLFRLKQRTAARLSLERQYNSMRAACEVLRFTGEDGLMIEEGRALMGGSERKAVAEGREGMDLVGAAERQSEVGRLFKIAMIGGQEGVVPIEYARSQTETPPRGGWDHAWTR